MADSQQDGDRPLSDVYGSEFRWPESYFDIEASSDVAFLVGQTAFLTCRVQVAGNWTVSLSVIFCQIFHTFLAFAIQKPIILLFYGIRPMLEKGI